MKASLYISCLLLLSSSVGASDCSVKDPDIQGYYSGGCKNGFASGKGLAIGRDKYEGEFLDGDPHGFGVYSWGPSSEWTGDIYEGNWVKGERTGYGTYSSPKSSIPNIKKINGIYVAEGIFLSSRLTHLCEGKDNCIPLNPSTKSNSTNGPFKNINQETYSALLTSLKGIPQTKGEFETTDEFNQRKQNYLGSISNQFTDIVYVFELKTSPTYDADKAELAVYHPFTKIRNSNDEYSIRWVPSYYENTGYQELEGLGKVILGQDKILTYTEHSFDVHVSVKGHKQFSKQLRIDLPPNKAKIFKGKYRWKIGVELNPNDMDYDMYPSDSDNALSELGKGYIKSERYHDINGQVAFLTLFIEDNPTKLYEYYSNKYPKDVVESYYK